MTKTDKLREMVRKDVERGFKHELTKALNSYSPYVAKLKAHPRFIEDVVDELIEKQLHWYETVSDETVDAAYTFFASKAGDEWIALSTKFAIDMGLWMDGFVRSVAQRLDAVN